MIKVLKLSTGEEIIGDVSDKQGVMVIKNPCGMQLMPSRTDPNKATMGLFPIAQHIKTNTISVSADHIIYVGEPVDEIYNQYNSIYGSGLTIVR